MMKKRKIPIIGAEGNVGKGIGAAFINEGWEVLPIDPKVNKALEGLTGKEFKKLFCATSLVVYVADCGNREEYTKNSSLGAKNDRRFANFCQGVVKVNPEIIIWYVGGSWTKREPNKDWIVDDDSPNKSLKECNAYESAKISAEGNAEKLSRLIKIRFLDWASIVPNLAPNFSISRMVKQALEEKRIKYSPGPFGRPLLETVQAGEAMVVLIKNDDVTQWFARFLIPGTFIPFSEFAQAVKDVVEEKTRKKVILEKIGKTPDFLKSRSRSFYLERLGFIPNRQRTQAALRENAKKVFERVRRTSPK